MVKWRTPSLLDYGKFTPDRVDMCPVSCFTCLILSENKCYRSDRQGKATGSVRQAENPLIDRCCFEAAAHCFCTLGIGSGALCANIGRIVGLE